LTKFEKADMYITDLAPICKNGMGYVFPKLASLRHRIAFCLSNRPETTERKPVGC